MTVAEKEGVDLSIAGALEGKTSQAAVLQAPSRGLGEVAAPSLLLSDASADRSVSISKDRGDHRFLDCASTGSKNALWLAEADRLNWSRSFQSHAFHAGARRMGAQRPNRRASAKRKNSRGAISWGQRRRVASNESEIDDTDDRLCARAILRNQSAPNCSSYLRPSTSKAPCHR